MPRIDLEDHNLELRAAHRWAMEKQGTEICLDCWKRYVYPHNSGLTCIDHPSYDSLQIRCALCGILLNKEEN